MAFLLALTGWTGAAKADAEADFKEGMKRIEKGDPQGAQLVLKAAQEGLPAAQTAFGKIQIESAVKWLLRAGQNGDSRATCLAAAVEKAVALAEIEAKEEKDKESLEAKRQFLFGEEGKAPPPPAKPARVKVDVAKVEKMLDALKKEVLLGRNEGDIESYQMVNALYAPQLGDEEGVEPDMLIRNTEMLMGAFSRQAMRDRAKDLVDYLKSFEKKGK